MSEQRLAGSEAGKRVLEIALLTSNPAYLSTTKQDIIISLKTR